MKTIADLLRVADERVRAGNLLGALHAYGAVVQLQPMNLDARQRLGDVLLALGETQRGAVALTGLARLAANSGYPLRALVALKVLIDLEPQLASLVGPLAEMYAASSERLGRGVRVAPGDPRAELPPTLDLSRTPPKEKLLPSIERLATDLAGAQFPTKLPPIPLLSQLGSFAFASAIEQVKLRRVPAGEVIVREGEVGRSFFVVASGHVVVTKRTDAGAVELAQLHEGAVFGEMALVSADPRTATVRAVHDSDVFEFDREALGAARGEVEVLAAALDRFAHERLVSNLIATSRLFAPLEREQRVDLVRRFARVEAPAGSVILRQGDPGKGLFVLLTGEVEVRRTDGEVTQVLATLRSGELFGEMSLLHREPVTADVIATRPTLMLFLDQTVFARLLEAFPDVRAYVEQLGEDRAMDTRLMLEGQNEPEIEIEFDDSPG